MGKASEVIKERNETIQKLQAQIEQFKKESIDNSANFELCELDGENSRNEIEKLKSQVRYCEELKQLLSAEKRKSQELDEANYELQKRVYRFPDTANK